MHCAASSTTCSRIAPCICGHLLALPKKWTFSQWLAAPARQKRQTPQLRDGLSATRWPGCRPCTCAPSSSTWPEASCPGVSGARRGDDKVADPPRLVVVQVGAADTDRLDPHAHLVRGQRLGRPVGDAQIARALDFAVAPAVLPGTSGFSLRPPP